MTIRRATVNKAALNAFLTAKIKIDAMPARLKTLSDAHFDAHPDEITCGEIGTLSHYASLLREIADLETKDDGDVILGTDANGHNDLLPRNTTKQTMLIALLWADEDASMVESVAANGWQAHYADVGIMPMWGFKSLFLVGIAEKVSA